MINNNVSIIQECRICKSELEFILWDVGSIEWVWVREHNPAINLRA